MKIMIAMLENLHGRLDEALPYMLQLAIQELTALRPNVAKNFQSMILQFVCMSFWYNTSLTFQILEHNQWTFPVFSRLLKVMPRLSLSFELRRVIFGLAAIVGVDPSILPQMVSERLPYIV
jgi:hypothetical protein